MGIAGKHVLKSFGPFKDIKVRYVTEKREDSFQTLDRGSLTGWLPHSFAGVVYPGETLVTEMWKESNKVIFSESRFYCNGRGGGCSCSFSSYEDQGTRDYRFDQCRGDDSRWG